VRPCAVPFLVLLLSFPAFAAPDSPEGFEDAPVRTLREAAGAGIVRAAGVEPRSYRGIVLLLENRTAKPLAIDLCASHLRPRRRGSVQRLGIGPARTPLLASRRGKGTVVVHLKPRERGLRW